MNKKTVVWLMVGVILIFIGATMFTGIMFMLKWDFTKLSTTKYEMSSYKIENEYNNINIKTDTAKIEFFPSEDGKTRVECHDQTNLKHNVTVADGTLTIELNDTRLWYEHIGINFGSSYINVFLPENEYGKLEINSSTGDTVIPGGFVFESIDIKKSTGNVTSFASSTGAIKITTSTGDINVQKASASSFDLSVTTGKVYLDNITSEGEIKLKVSTGKAVLNDVKCGNFTSSGSTGDLELKNVVAEDKFSVERSTGDVKFDLCDAGEIYVETDTGNVNGSLCSEKVFIVSTDTGKIDVPKTISGGRCEITTDTGDIKISLK